MSEPRHVNPWIIAISVMFCTFMEVLDTTVVNVSLPHIAGNLSATIDEVTWVLTSYLVANAIILPITGWLSNYFGRKRLLLFSVMGFTLSSFLCGIAPSLPLLIIFRLMQGACGGALQPLSQAVLLESFPPDQRGKAMGFWGLGIVVAPVLGPVFGGWLTDAYSWRWVFYINLPVGLISLVMVQMFVFDPSYIKRSKSAIDYWGIGMLAVWIGALQIAFDKGEELDWFSSHFITILVVIAVSFAVGFLIRELMADHPVVNLSVFKLRSYSAGVFLMTVLGFVLYGSIVIIPIWLQTLLGYPAMATGFTMAPRGLGSMIGMPIIGMVVGRFDPRKILAGGLLLGAFSTWQLARLNLDVGFWDLFWPQAIQGFGLGMVFVPLTTIAMNPVPREAMGNATSLFNLMRNLGGSVGIAVVTLVNTRFQQKYTAVLGAHVANGNAAAGQWFGSLRSLYLSTGSGLGLADQQAYASLFGIVERQAAMRAFVDVFQLLTVAFLLMIPLTLIMRRPKSGAGPGPAAH
jgi:DHA2 family multidrug resistance protein